MSGADILSSREKKKTEKPQRGGGTPPPPPPSLVRRGLSLNKIRSILVGSGQRSSRMSCPSLLIGDANVPKLTPANSLDVHIHEALTWAANKEETSRKLTSASGALKRKATALFGRVRVQNYCRSKASKTTKQVNLTRCKLFKLQSADTCRPRTEGIRNEFIN